MHDVIIGCITMHDVIIGCARKTFNRVFGYITHVLRIHIQYVHVYMCTCVCVCHGMCLINVNLGVLEKG